MLDADEVLSRNRVDLEDPDPSTRTPAGRRGRLALGFPLLGFGLILLWIGGWVASFRQNELIISRLSWVPKIPMIAGDFKVHIDHIAGLHAAGIDPYHKFDDWVCFLHPYPPMIARCFAWVVLFETATASILWQGALGLIVSVGGLAAFRVRRELDLDSIPRLLIVAALLFTNPVMFAVERGQSDPMIILPLLAAAWLLGKNATWTDIAAGGLLGLTAWLKYYPGLTVVALVALGRKQAVVAFVATAGIIGIIDFDGVRESIKHAHQLQAMMNAVVHPVNDATHSIFENWGIIGIVRRSPSLRQVPAAVVASFLLLPALFLVSRRICLSRRSAALIFPYLLWLASAATFGLPYSNDYNLSPLPIAALAVWDRRDRWTVHLAILASILWSQPFRLPVSGEIMLALKFAALYGVGASLAAKARRIPDLGMKTPSETGARPDLPHRSRGRNANGRRPGAPAVRGPRSVPVDQSMSS